MGTEKERKAGRPRVFDLEQAVRDAQAMFWRHGLEATSLAAIATTIGVHKPSLYFAYGSKRALYLAAWDAYQKDAAALVGQALGQPTLREALTAFFAADIDMFTEGDGRGCFMLTTALPLAMSDKDMGERVRQAIASLEQAVDARIRRGAEADELSPSLNQRTATDLVLSTHFAIASRARAGEPRTTLLASADRLVDLVCAGRK